MSVLATGIGRIPEFRPTQRFCRHCAELYLPVERGDRYCRRPPCVEAKVRRERMRAMRRGH